MNVIASIATRLRHNPFDLTYWRVFADWLAERGATDRAELLHLEAQLWHAHGDPEREAPLVEEVQVYREVLREPWQVGFVHGTEIHARLHRLLDTLRTRPELALEDGLDALARLPGTTSWLALDQALAGEDPQGPLPLQGPCFHEQTRRIIRGVISRIDQAFDGVPVPDEDHLTLFQAEAADAYATCDRSRDHLGRWQDLPVEQMILNDFAWSYFDEQGMLYYLPAGATLRLRYAFFRHELPRDLGTENVFASIEHTIELARDIALFDWRQCQAMWTYSLVSGERSSPRVGAPKWEAAMTARTRPPLHQLM